ncbi:MAG: hypothetical protein ISF22_04965 [Methanomassiliicoccus sp.]|nr:hypothetical protein [Methanomassiliicoccus sp.]
MDGGEMNRNLMVGAAVVLVVIVIVAGMFVFGGLGDQERKSRSMYWTGTYEVGDLVIHSWYYANSTEPQTNEYTISEISPTEITISWMVNSTGPYPFTKPIDSSLAFGILQNISFDPTLRPTFNYAGDEAVETPWGSLVCQHLNSTSAPLENVDFWIYNGVVVKWTAQTYAGEMNAGILVDTNLEEITSS